MPPKTALSSFVCVFSMVIGTSTSMGQAPECPFLEDDISILFVDIDVTTSGDGSTWANAFKYVQDALLAANPATGERIQIWVAEGTYAPTDRWCTQTSDCGFTASACVNNQCVWIDPRVQTFLLNEDVELYGGFNGTQDPATFDLSDPSLRPHLTILTGDVARDDGPCSNPSQCAGGGCVTRPGEFDSFCYGDNSYHVVRSGGVAYNTAVEVSKYTWTMFYTRTAATLAAAWI